MKQIVKVQTSLFTSDGVPDVLVYNEDRSVMGQVPLTKEVLEAMDGEPKAFFWAEIPDGKETTVEILEEAPWQDW